MESIISDASFFAVFLGMPLALCLLFTFGIGDRRYVVRRAIIVAITACTVTLLLFTTILVWSDRIFYGSNFLLVCMTITVIAAFVTIGVAFIYRARVIDRRPAVAEIHPEGGA